MLKIFLAPLLFSTIVCDGVFPAAYYEEQFAIWMKQHGHAADEWKEDEYSTRLQNFAANVDMIHIHNSKNDSTYTLGLNKWSHLSHDEWASTFLKPMISRSQKNDGNEFHGERIQAAKSIDWVSKGAVGPVFAQGVCAACWAFSTAGAFSAAHFIKTGNYTDLSVQEILNCDKSPADHWCHGTNTGMDSAYAWVQKNGGLCAAADFSYDGNNSTECKKCKVVPATRPAKATDVAQNEDALLKAVSQQPVSVAMDCSCMGFMQYKSGVWNKDCGTKIDHALLVVGYGTDTKSSKDYWKVKNSWGKDWGEDGYVRFERGLTQTAGGHGISDIAAEAIFPTLEATSSAQDVSALVV